jgi:hypothetical protein
MSKQNRRSGKKDAEKPKNSHHESIRKMAGGDKVTSENVLDYFKLRLKGLSV